MNFGESTMTFALSTRSLQRLKGVKDPLKTVVCDAISQTTIDFGVIQGLRTVAQQKKYVAAGASQTMQSKHLTGDAVDVMAYIGSRGSWEADLYPKIADAFKEAATRQCVKIRWGGAWNVEDIRSWSGTMEEAMNAYVEERRKQGEKPFLDLGHFELN